MTTGTTADALAAVRRLSAAILAARDEHALYSTFAEVMFGVCDVDRVHVSRLGTGTHSTVSTALAPAPDGHGAEVEEEYRIPPDRPSGVHHVRATGEALQVPDAPSSPLVARQFILRFRAASVIYLPLVVEARVHAVAILISHTPRTFEAQELEIAYTMANQVSAGLAVLDMRERLGARADRSAALARAAGALNARLDLRAVLDALCAESGRAMNADFAGFYLGDARRGGVAIAGHNVPPESDWWGRKVDLGEGMAGQVLLTGEPAVSNDYQGDRRIEADVLRHAETTFAVPVRWDGELKGALSIAFNHHRPIFSEDIDTLQAMADLAAFACSNAEAFERAQAAAQTDSLTGFLNHGAVQVRLREEIWRARRENQPLSCLLADLDNFKPVNDRHGHLVGDELLQQVATAIAAEFRPYDGVARYGGDEFVLILPGADENAALDAARRLRAVVRETSRGLDDTGARVTASVGVARWREPLTAGELLDRADRALLLAKRQGKDGIELASPRTEALLARVELGEDRSDPLATFWDLVSRSDSPRDVLVSLPSLLRRELDLEEVAMYEPCPGARELLVRLVVARQPGDPAPPAFRRREITVGGDLRLRLHSGPISRGSLPALEVALEGHRRARRSDSPAGSYAAIGLVRGDSLLGLMLLRHRLPQFPRPELRTAEVLAGEAVTVVLSHSGDGSRSAVAALAAAIDARENSTLSHSEEVVGLAVEVGRKLGLTSTELAKVRDGAMLHDIGKIAIPNEILYKSAPLSPEEWETMRGHPIIGEGILLRTPELAPIAPLVRHEHERWDGRGYPDGLAGEAIPIGSRIILACDAYHAMIAARPYRDPLTQPQAVAELREGAGSQFDPRVVDALLDVLAASSAPAASRA